MNKMNWIKFSDKLPERGQFILICYFSRYEMTYQTIRYTWFDRIAERDDLKLIIFHADNSISGRDYIADKFLDETFWLPLPMVPSKE